MRLPKGRSDFDLPHTCRAFTGDDGAAEARARLQAQVDSLLQRLDKAEAAVRICRATEPMLLRSTA